MHTSRSSTCRIATCRTFLSTSSHFSTLRPALTLTTDTYLAFCHSLLQPSPHPPSIKSLFLNHNHFSLGSESSLTSISETLGATLSSSSSSLRSIAFTSNRAIGPSGLIPLLSSLKLATSHLAEIRLSVTQLTPECAEPLARWLEDPEGGARLQVLGVNACALGQAGVRRIARAVISGRAASLVHIEYHANEEGDDERWEAVNAPLLAKEEGEETGDWKAQLEAALKRNQRVYQETKMAARRLAATARVVFGGNTVEAESTEEEERSDPTVFPFLRLPIELQVHVLRCFLLLTPSTTAHLYPSTTSSSSCSSSAAISTSSVGTILSCPLTESQFLRIIAHCASRSTLETGRRIAAAHAAGEAPSLNTGRTASSSSAAAGRAESKDQDAGVAWEDWFLRSTGCDRFERAARM